MSKVRKVTRRVMLIVLLCLVLTVSGSYAIWVYTTGKLPDSKDTSSSISFIFPYPTSGLSFNTLSATSGNLYGAMDDEGNVSVDDAQDHLLKSYTPFSIEVINDTDLKEAKTAIISFEITFCLAPYFVENGYSTSGYPQYPFQDAFTISRDGEEIASGVMYVAAKYREGNFFSGYNYNDTTGDILLEKDETGAVYKSDTTYGVISGHDYYYYTATITYDLLSADVNDFLLEAGESANFVFTMEHTQTNNYACFASMKVIAREYNTETE